MTNLFRGSLDMEEFKLNGLNISSVTSVANMFADNPNLKSINIDGVDFGTLSVNTVFNMLLSPTIETVDLSKTSLQGQLQYNASNWSNFNLFSDIKGLKNLIVPNIDFFFRGTGGFFSNAPLEVLKIGTLSGTYYNGNYMQGTFRFSMMFSGRKYLKEASVKELIFNSSLTQYLNLSSMFSGCTSLETFDLGNSDTSYNISLNSMFRNCQSIETIDLS